MRLLFELLAAPATQKYETQKSAKDTHRDEIKQVTKVALMEAKTETPFIAHVSKTVK